MTRFKVQEMVESDDTVHRPRPTDGGRGCWRWQAFPRGQMASSWLVGPRPLGQANVSTRMGTIKNKMAEGFSKVFRNAHTDTRAQL